ncbi:RNA 2',3'-cyclic phosphodiesterase [Methylonatrum kenyense]|uniref:RNA 2',3'-cyclic phosphodiesterase n=1 Tax=Methylonatrum kenyense TaxID=455253 RepID=UPI0020BFBAB8|nr:RNA 2',3'-cyclic phosphodiesterase [Methylonatrum kenyense]MCK8516461.1 RNA 2',3'-cyclic phosphodiesterase [Methylonatrum kenyense]
MSDEAVRLFFAMQPEREVRASLHRAAAAIGAGRPTPADNIHLTLFFLGRCDHSQRQQAERVGSAIRSPVTLVRTTELEYWSGPRAGVLLAEPLDDELIRLQQDLRQALENAGFVPDRRPFRPHLTLLRKLDAPTGLPELPSQRLRLAGFGLFLSRPGAQGSVYEHLRYWPAAD